MLHNLKKRLLLGTSKGICNVEVQVLAKVEARRGAWLAQLMEYAILDLRV